ncbi:MAG: hypothetical protein ACT4PZ_11185 [Panacagrimonas sp.]
MNRIAAALVVASSFAGLLAQPAVAATPSDFALAFTAEEDTEGDSTLTRGITLVGAANFNQTRAFIGNTTVVIDPQVHFAGRLDGQNLVDFRPHTLVYGQSNRWRRIPLRGSLSSKPVTQFSSETAANSRCGIAKLIPVDLKVALSSLLVYRLPGTDRQCSTADDVFRSVRLTDSRTTKPRKVVARTLELKQVYSPTGVLLAHYALEGTNLRHYSPDLRTTKVVKSGTTTFVPAGQTPDGVLIALIDGQVRRITAQGTLVSVPLKRPDSGYKIVAAGLEGDRVYVVEEKTTGFASRLYRVPASTPEPVRMRDETSKKLTVQGFTPVRLIFTTRTAQGAFELLAVPRTATVANAPVRLRGAPGPIVVSNTFKNRVFFNVFGSNNTPRAFVSEDAKKDVALADYGNGSLWLGFQRDFNPIPGKDQRDPQRLLLVRGGAPGTTGRGANLLSLDPENLQTAQLIDLPDTTTPALGFALGPAGMGAVVENRPGSVPNFDVFALDLVGERLLRLNDNTPANESPVF